LGVGVAHVPESDDTDANVFHEGRAGGRETRKTARGNVRNITKNDGQRVADGPKLQTVSFCWKTT
jgi:hypothetical protein